MSTATLKPLARYKLLVGRHIGKDPATGKSRTYNQGETFDSRDNLLALNSGPGARKFEKICDLEEPTPTSPTKPIEDNFDSMTVMQLEEYALDHEIDLEGVSKKADIIAKLRAAQ